MDLLIIIFSGAALLGVCITLVNFVQRLPRGERLAVLALMAVGALLVLTISLFVTTGDANRREHDELCAQANANRQGILSLIVFAEQEHPATEAELRRIEESIDGPVC